MLYILETSDSIYSILNSSNATLEEYSRVELCLLMGELNWSDENVKDVFEALDALGEYHCTLQGEFLVPVA